jgi:hypothetical protein
VGSGDLRMRGVLRGLFLLAGVRRVRSVL